MCDGAACEDKNATQARGGRITLPSSAGARLSCGARMSQCKIWGMDQCNLNPGAMYREVRRRGS